ncbi:hypothetical protein GGF41_003286 [Coemansia sp. RSA 2531]|nr:hypothetical protein GGF41_003286 [Coemansia sp. RSA 2531]
MVVNILIILLEVVSVFVLMIVLLIFTSDFSALMELVDPKPPPLRVSSTRPAHQVTLKPLPLPLPLPLLPPPSFTFQTLPILIVYKIVEYLEGRPKYFLGLDIDKHNKLKTALVPLLLVSERWRIAALESICDNCALDFDDSYDDIKILHLKEP